MSGLFVVIEGPEGAGKSTLAAALGRRIEAAGRRLQRVHEPGSTVFAHHLRQLVLDPASKIDAVAELFMILAARADLVEKEIRPQLANGWVVLSDRFDLSTMAYQVAGRGLPREAVVAANALATGGLRPDLTLVLDIPAGVGEARQRAAGKALDRMEQEDRAFHERVGRAYLEASGEGVVHLDASLAPAAVADAAWKQIEARLGR